LISSSLIRRNLFVAAALACSVAACGETSATSDLAVPDENAGAGDDGGGTTAPDTDAATPKAGTVRGNPLCNVQQGQDQECMPDDDGANPTAGQKPCATALPEGGIDGAAAATAQGCRLTKGNDSTVVPACLSASYAGTDGAKCTSGADCAPGFDCVDSDGGAGTFCRRYCCLGTCGDQSANSGHTFCDVQKLVDTGTKAPMCIPLKPCTLLSTQQCATDETCAVVNDDGETGCVPRGGKQNGESCEDEHCALNLTCLGQPGNRKCRTLCKVDGAQMCANGQVCKTTSAFKDPTFGICQAP
jgi:hypothetical protein